MVSDSFLLDTNVVLYFLGGRCNLPPGRHHVSVITELEALSFPDISSREEEAISQFLSAVEIVGLTPPIRKETVRLRRQSGLKLPDAIVVATASTLGATLLTNDKKLARLVGVRVHSVDLDPST